MKKLLRTPFFNRSAIVVAPELLGKFLVCKGKSGAETLMITEVEAYEGFKDLASHAARGQTPRNAPMFGPPGRWYVYLVYGNYFMLNIVTGAAGYPAAVLIRGVAGINGPGRLTKRLAIDKKFNGLPATLSTGLWLEDRGVRVAPASIERRPRVGVDYAGPVWSKKRWRFCLKHF